MFGLSSGEISVQQRIEREKGMAHAGQLIRLIDIRVEDNIITNTHGKTPAEFVKKLKYDCARYYGYAGPEFLKALILSYSGHAEAAFNFRARVDEWCAGAVESGRPISGLHERGLLRFALVAVAGGLACEWGILPIDSEDVDRSVLEVAHSWLDDAISLTDGERGVRAVREFLQRHQFSRFPFPQENEAFGARDCAGFRSGDFFLFTDAGFREACGAYGIPQVAEELKRRGILVIDDPARIKAKHLFSGGHRYRFYKVRSCILED